MVRITTNMPALMAWRQSGETQDKGSLSMERLAKDLRTSSDDDRTKTDVSEKMRDKIRGHNQAIYDVQQEISLLQTAAGGLDEINSRLQDVRGLLQPDEENSAAGGKINVQQIMSANMEEIDLIAGETQFAGKYLLNGSASAPMVSMDREALGISNLNTLDSVPGGQSLQQVEAAVERVAFERGRLAEGLSQLEHRLENLLTASENLSASESLIRESGVALESLSSVIEQIGLNAKQALLAQGNLQQQRTSHLLFNTES